MTAMKSSLSGLFLLLLLFSSSVSGLGSVLRRTYHYIESYYTWLEAQSHCRSDPDFVDLAVFYRDSEKYSVYIYNYSAWVGLYKEDEAWTWTRGGKLKKFYRGPNEGDGTHNCAYFSNSDTKFHGASCESSFFFVCEYQGKKDYRYRFIPQSMTWSDARQYCKKTYSDLASFTPIERVYSGIQSRNIPAWTGLHKNGTCVTISSWYKNMTTRDCSSRLPFVCFKDNLVLVKENKTWEEALEHCRAMRSTHSYLQHRRYELFSMQPEDHSSVMAKLIDSITEEVWAGLRFMGGHWWWVNGADLLYSDLPDCPLKWQNCGALSKNNTVSMKARDCLEKKNFLCYLKWFTT